MEMMNYPLGFDYARRDTCYCSIVLSVFIEVNIYIYILLFSRVCLGLSSTPTGLGKAIVWYYSHFAAPSCISIRCT